MRDPRLPRRLIGVAAAVAVLGLVGAPSAMSQDDGAWAGSTFTAPAGENQPEPSFPIAGTFIHREQTITNVEVEFGTVIDGTYDEAEGDPCVPEDPGLVADEPGNGLERYDFTVQTPEGDNVVWPCNGRFRIDAVAFSEGIEGRDTHTLTKTIVIALPPPPVETVTATADGGTATIQWEAVDDPSPDFLGYRVERAGPKADGGYGPFVAVSGDLGTASTSATDRPEVSGDYRYRVRSLRNGADEPVTSPEEGTGVADLNVTVATTTTKAPRETSAGSASGNGRGRAVPRVPGSSGSTRIPAASPPTTADTGFDDELDYGDRALREPGSDELAEGGEGQSIIRTEGDGAGLVVPAAGALVLLGWAGHVVYLNRLAKQF